MNSLKSAFRSYRRIAGVLLLFLAALTGGISSARATAFGNGQIIFDSIAGAGFNTYTFTVTSGTFFISIWESGTHSTTSNAEFMVIRPNSTQTGFYGDGNYNNQYVSGIGVLPGTYTVKVYNYQGSATAAAYGLQISWVPGMVAVPNGQLGGAMQPSTTETDSVAIGAADIWTFQGIASSAYTLTLTKASGGAGFCSYMEIFNSTGTYLGLSSTCTSTTAGGTAVAGTYYVGVTNAYLGNGTGSYTLKATGAGVDMTGQGGNGDGVTCLTCHARQQGPVPQSPGVPAIGAVSTQQSPQK